MATAKKSSAPKKAAAKKTAVKRAPTKASTATKVSHKVKPSPRSFRRSAPEQPFMTFRPTIQTVYWLVLALFVLGMSLWVAVNSIRIQALYDHIDEMTNETNSIVMPKAKH